MKKYTFRIIFFKNILNPYVLLLNFYYKHLKIIENINIDVGKVTNKTWANIRIAHRIHKSNVTLPPISDSHKKMWPDKKKSGMVRTWADVVSE